MKGSRFSPPAVRQDAYLPRPRLLQFIERQGRGCSCLFIEGRAGQGKTTLATQFVQATGLPCLWFALDDRDNDPLHLLLRWAEGLAGQFPDSALETVHRLFAQPLSQRDVPRLTRLLQDAMGQLADELLLVFEDLHRLADDKPGLAVLGELISQRPSAMQVLMTSRAAITPRLQSAPADTLVVNDDHLAFDLHETGLLVRDILQLPLTPEQIHELHATTEGWVMGLILAERLTMGVDGSVAPSRLRGLNRQMLDYFQQELVGALPEAWVRTLVKWALPDRLPAELAADLAETDDIAALLTDHTGPGLFHGLLRRTDEQAGEAADYQFHQGFQEALRYLAPSVLGAEQREVWLQAGRWFQQREYVGPALACYLGAEQPEAAAELLETQARQVRAQHSSMQLQAWLSQLPSEVMAGRPWLAFLQGTVAMELDPPAALDWLQQAVSGFADAGRDAEELMALGSLLHVYWYARPDFRIARPLLARAEQLMAEVPPPALQNSLPQVLLSLALGALYCEGDQQRALHWLHQLAELNQQVASPDLAVLLECGRALVALFGCDWIAGMAALERAQARLVDPGVTQLTRESQAMIAANVLIARGDIDLYQVQRQVLSPHSPLMRTTVGNPYLVLWDLEALLNGGHLDIARDLLDEALQQDVLAGAHMQSQLLSYQAVVQALQGDAAAATETIARAEALRATVLGPWFECFGRLQWASACLFCDRLVDAEAYLEMAASQLEALQAPNLEALLLALRAALHLQAGDKPAAHQALQAFLQHMEQSGLTGFYGATPWLLTPLLSEAVRADIESALARRLARTLTAHAISDPGQALPLLTLTVLGDISLTRGEQMLLRPEDLTEAQRQLLVLLALAPQHALHQESLLVSFWPDAPTAKARASLDALVARTRRLLDGILPAGQGRDYLLLQKGVLCLRNVQVDVDLFRRRARRGLKLFEQGHGWEGSLTLQTALGVWTHQVGQGRYLPETLSAELQRLHRQVVLRLVAYWQAQQRPEPALSCLRTAFLDDPAETELCEPLYRLLTSHGQSAEARRMAELHGNALQALDIPQSEIDDLLAGFGAAGASGR